MGVTNIEEVFRNIPAITTYSTPNQEASVVQIVGSSSLSSNLRMRGFDANQTEQNVFGSDVVVSEAASLFHGIFEDLLGFGRKFDAVGVKICGAAGDASHDFTDAV